MQLEHAILILFSTIWPLAGLKYDSINYCQENPGAKPFSRRMFRGVPVVTTGLFSPRAVGYGDTWLSPIPPQLPCWPHEAEHRPRWSLGTIFGAFFFFGFFQPCICLQEKAGAVGTLCCWLLTCDTSLVVSASLG